MTDDGPPTSERSDGSGPSDRSDGSDQSDRSDGSDQSEWADGPVSLRGADATTVRRAIAERRPFPGGRGFAGRVGDLLVRDVLGREPLFYDADSPDPLRADAWSWTPDGLATPRALPAGHVLPAADASDGPGADAVDEQAADASDGPGADAVDERVAHAAPRPRRRWTLPAPSPVTDADDAVALVRSALDGALGNVAAAGEDTAVAFSGGVDSAVLAAATDAPLYVAGFPESHDVQAARSAAAALDREVRVVELTHDDLERAVPEIVAATGRPAPMAVQIALPLYLTAQGVAADGYDRLLLGQGADEAFGGYDKVANAPDDERVAADTVRGARREVLAGLPDQLERDVLALRAAGVEPVTPYLDDRVMEAALALAGDHLVRDGVRKWALREAAATWLPEDVRSRPKKAAQYGSLVARELARLARQAGFKPRMTDNVGQYVRSLSPGYRVRGPRVE